MSSVAIYLQILFHFLNYGQILVVKDALFRDLFSVFQCEGAVGAPEQ